MTYDANFIIQQFGGVKKLAKAINKDPATIYRWTYPKKRQGTGGRIPSSALNGIIKAAAALNISLEQQPSSVSTTQLSTQPHQFIHWFRQTAPYIHAHRGKTFVIYISGDAVNDALFSTLIEDIALLHSLGIRLILVHGIRPQLEKKLALYHHSSQVFQHLRVTDKLTLDLAKEATGVVRADIEAKLATSISTLASSKTTIKIASGNFILAKPLGVINGVDYQFTGDVRRVNGDAISNLLSSGQVLLISPLGYSPSGDIFNLRSEEIATAIATEIKADKLILMTEQAEVLSTNKKLIRQLTTEQAQALLKTSTNDQDDAYLHLQEAIRASQLGVKRVHLVDRKINGGLQLELFTRQGSGTMISVQPFEDARPANINDLHGIIELIRPLEARGLLSYRSNETLEMDIDKFHVIEQDGLITTCAALYEYPNEQMAELACVAVHPDYRNGERGEYLLSMIEDKARSKGLKHLFVLTTQSSHWFAEKGFFPATLNDLPVAKRQNYNQTRRSIVMIKALS
ncbi:MAG: amino-acid N-acetyltransferase [Cycloclasticus sp.]|nr:amino-acid N-acetyltransferase [Cycloclasticus sp.]MBG96587.1 amino-acid N-acetyltransferase [Cycloclasticus sp.]HAI96236.1 amino-acid N-acetyltransferase [Methylococcaceae bacterium]|tara:strand:- start:1124 stop:2668 length:1545 start_codon:yes stop_codon:yes gene_type:complete